MRKWTDWFDYDYDYDFAELTNSDTSDTYVHFAALCYLTRRQATADLANRQKDDQCRTRMRTQTRPRTKHDYDYVYDHDYGLARPTNEI